MLSLFFFSFRPSGATGYLLPLLMPLQEIHAVETLVAVRESAIECILFRVIFLVSSANRVLAE